MDCSTVVLLWDGWDGIEWVYAGVLDKLGPGQLGPGAQLSGAQLFAPKKCPGPNSPRTYPGDTMCRAPCKVLLIMGGT